MRFPSPAVLLATGDADGRVRVFTISPRKDHDQEGSNLGQGQEEDNDEEEARRLVTAHKILDGKEHRGAVTSLHLDGQKVLSASVDNSIKVGRIDLL